jgi:hypothetical protein
MPLHRQHSPNREAYEAGYDRGLMSGYLTSRSSHVMQPERIPGVYDNGDHRDDFVAGWQRGFTFGLKARGMGRTL